MSMIDSDRALRRALDGLNAVEQRRLGALFVESALDLCDDARIKRTLDVAKDPGASREECDEAFHSAKAYAIHSYAECGRDTDWSQQAAHFVASAAACLLADEGPAGASNRAWKAAMQVRNARNCALIGPPSDMSEDEATRQYRIASAFLGH